MRWREKKILCISLIHLRNYTIDNLKHLYHLRWGIEEYGKLFKVRADLESFSGMSALSVNAILLCGYIFNEYLCGDVFSDRAKSTGLK